MAVISGLWAWMGCVGVMGPAICKGSRGVGSGGSWTGVVTERLVPDVSAALGLLQLVPEETSSG